MGSTSGCWMHINKLKMQFHLELSLSLFLARFAPHPTFEAPSIYSRCYTYVESSARAFRSRPNACLSPPLLFLLQLLLSLVLPPTSSKAKRLKSLKFNSNVAPTTGSERKSETAVSLAVCASHYLHA